MGGSRGMAQRPTMDDSNCFARVMAMSRALNEFLEPSSGTSIFFIFCITFQARILLITMPVDFHQRVLLKCGKGTNCPQKSPLVIRLCVNILRFLRAICPLTAFKEYP